MILHSIQEWVPPVKSRTSVAGLHNKTVYETEPRLITGKIMNYEKYNHDMKQNEF